jgi:hypothetical protein
VSYEIERTHEISKLIAVARSKYGRPVNDSFNDSAHWNVGGIEIEIKKGFMGDHKMSFTNTKISNDRIRSDNLVMDKMGQDKASKIKAF